MVVARLQDNWQTLRADLFPATVLLALSDQLLSVQRLPGRRESLPQALLVPIPAATCRDGRPLQVEALGDQGFHRFKNRHHRAFAVDGATAPDKAIGNRPGERRVSPQFFGAWCDGHHVLVRHQQNRRQLAVLARPAQQDAWAAGGERFGVGCDLWVALRQPLTHAGEGGVAGRQLAGRRADLMRQGRQANGGRQALGSALAIQPFRQADRGAVVCGSRQ